MVLIVCLLPIWLTLRDVVGARWAGGELSFGIHFRSRPLSQVYCSPKLLPNNRQRISTTFCQAMQVVFK
jgi:hypothetical protein